MEKAAPNSPGFVSNVKRIAILRPRALGDIIFALPAIAALHHTYPGAEILFLGHAWHQELLINRVPGISQVIPVPPPKLERLLQGAIINEAEQDIFLHQMQSAQIDIGIQMAGGGEYSNPLLLQCQPRISVGAKSPRAEPLDRWIPFSPYQNDIVRNLEIVELVGAHTTTELLRPKLHVLESDLTSASDVLDRIHQPFIVIHPGSTDLRRQWSPDKFAQVADYCKRDLGLEVVLLGTRIDTDQVQAILDVMKEKPIDLSGRLSIAALIGVISKAALMFANDSGPLHLALATGTRATGMFMAEYIANSMPLYRSDFLPLISWDRNCPICGKVCDKVELEKKNPQPCSHNVSFINEIKVEDAIKAIEVLLTLQTA